MAGQLVYAEFFTNHYMNKKEEEDCLMWEVEKNSGYCHEWRNLIQRIKVIRRNLIQRIKLISLVSYSFATLASDITAYYFF